MKAISGILISVVLHLILSRQSKDLAIILSLAVCTMILYSGFIYLRPVIDFFQNIQNIGNLDSDMVKIMMKALGIGILSQITTMICNDAGNTALGKSLQLLSAVSILFLSLPVLNQLLSLLDKIMGAV